LLLQIQEKYAGQEFLPQIDPLYLLDTERGQTFGSPIDQVTWNRSRRELDAAMQRVPGFVDSAGADWGSVTGRNYGVLEEYRMEDAQQVIVTMGSMCGTVREAVDTMRNNGEKVGLLKVRLFRPFPAAAIRQAIKGASVALVLDRNYSPGMGGILHQELKAALYGMADAPKVHGLLAGVGGVNVSPNKIQQLVTEYKQIEPSAESLWVE